MDCDHANFYEDEDGNGRAILVCEDCGDVKLASDRAPREFAGD